ncbi:hypothetical protein DSAG12_02322 [Promethearchaeum syntrophicum]|uniref:DNA mismatch repair proteins mutS family domain-containing protein n=1 Tax=Promethearchaeum syntrophicum TaxID=2594042 RepID=A0A5B9DBJ4_9ARCH|nr:hypothetical protein [Candidatus Prometheoarchaeum syntrophicum]QEE16492.1 DNA-binding protein MutS2 [Candidatus Prometheoarchaeum syntrophicum]
MVLHTISDKLKLLGNKKNSSIFKLDMIPGIGKKIQERLKKFYITESNALNAIEAGVTGIVPGISYKQALKYAQYYFQIHENIVKEDILVTQDIRDIYSKIIDLISEYTHTNYSKLKLQLYFPLPSNKLTLLKERQEYFGKSIEFYKKYVEILEEKELPLFLSKLDDLKQTEDIHKISNRLIITDSKQVERYLQEENIDDFVKIEIIDLNKISNWDTFFKEYCDNFDVVIYCGNHSHDLPAFGNLISLNSKEFSTESLIPEKIIRFFSLNKSLIHSMIKIIVILKNLKEDHLISKFLDMIEIKSIKDLKEKTKILDDFGEIIPGINDELDEFRRVSKDFTSLIHETENQINENIKKEISERSIKIQGKQILDLIRTDVTLENIRNYIPAEVDDLINEKVQSGLLNLEKQLKLKKLDGNIAANLMPELIEFPIQLNEKELDSLEKKINSRYNTAKYYEMVRIAKVLSKNQEYLLKLHQTLLEFDFFYAIGNFAFDYHLSIPELDETNHGFYGKELINLNLQKAALSGDIDSISITDIFNPVPINYQLGDIVGSSSHHLSKGSLNLLTGSNSGGKTMCIITCSESIILAQMGFPSLGHFKFHPFDEIYFFKKSNGQLSAGAFETTLLQFVQLAQSSKLKVVFADELESITEPNAASKVISGIFSLFLTNPNNYGVFVTHLVDLLQREINSDQRKNIRIDGIEATGLDKNLQLIVDRSPRFNYVAKSTPELILKRLAQSGTSDQRKFFSSLLDKF